MTTSTSRETNGRPPHPAPQPADRTRTGGNLARADTVRRWAAGLALMLAPLGLLAANTGYAWATRDGGSDETGADLLALVGQHPSALRLTLIAVLAGSLLLVPAILGAMRLAGRRAPWLSLAGGSLMLAGYVCYLGATAAEAPVLAMAQAGGHEAVFAHVIDLSRDDAATQWMFVLFILGNLVGTFLLGLALLRSRAVAAWAAIAVLAWPVLHIAGLAAGSEWFEVAGAALMAAGLATAGVAVLRHKGGWSAGLAAGSR